MNTAFISYSRADIDIAIDLGKKLEKYPYPQEMVADENRPYDPKLVRPVFLDVLDLPVKTTEFSKDIQDNLRNSRYLIVICSESSAKSEFVKKEIDFFLSTHDNNADLIVAVYVDHIFSGMHPVIDNIVAIRNCPIYVTGRGEAGAVGRKYCFYHLLEFLLKVDFDKLYNRYEAYKRRKIRRRWVLTTTILVLIFGTLSWALISQGKRTKAERKQAQIYEKKAEFEQNTFPLSIVVGYVGNFLRPMVESLCENGECPEVLVYMPYSYEELDFRTRLRMYDSYLKAHYSIDSKNISRQNIRVQSRRRDMTIVRIDFDSVSVYVDNATTVSAFKSVIDYKMSIKDIDWGMDSSQMVQLYTDKFIKSSLDSLGAVAPHVHFVRDTNELKTILSEIKNEDNYDK
ncbi:MAG: toll/interleukin-1 receptor domain-containing protein [Bacteroidales bacterium]|nr:toll/interleukin-1 receptor domain-containing protein [Bacteroidales bacterium]